MKKILLFCLISLVPLFAIAQYPDIDDDSVWVEGRVTDAITGQPQARCEVQFMQEGKDNAIAFCDSAGYYSIGWMPVGLYTLSVVSEGKTLHYTELQLTQSSMVNIALMPDSLNMRPLRPAEVTASRIQPVYNPINSPDDSRLWNLNGNPILMESGPASSPCGPSSGRAYFFRPGSLASWRPAWLDAPFPHPVKKNNPTEANDDKKEEK